MMSTMEMSQGGICLPADVQSKSYINSLCDVSVNKNRELKDFERLLAYLDSHPKECTPHKRKILEHLKIHGLENPNADHRLLASCFARAATLFRQTPNKSEGAIGAWKCSLVSELVNLEENLNQLYSTAGISTKSILEDSNDDIDIEDVDLEEVTSKPNNDPDWQNLINSHLFKVNLAAHYVCGLISLRTDYNLPIPVLVLLRIASRVGNFRLQSYRKKPKSNIKEYCYSLTPHLIAINLMLFESVVDVLGTNVIPFIPLINSTLSQLLEWTRTSHLLEHDANLYHSLRAQLFNVFANFMDQLSLNTNLEPRLLKKLLETELVDDVRKLFLVDTQPVVEKLTTLTDSMIRSQDCKDIHITNAIRCIQSIFVAYRGLFEPKLELVVKSVVVEACIRMYNSFDPSRFQLPIRKQLLELLLSIANQPYATSTTELSYNIFELANRLESESEIKSLIRSALRVGLAHRPTIVSHYDVYNVYGHGMTSTVHDDDDYGNETGEAGAADISSSPSVSPVESETATAGPTVSCDAEKVSDVELVEVDVEETEANEVEVLEQAVAGTSTKQPTVAPAPQVVDRVEPPVKVVEMEAEAEAHSGSTGGLSQSAEQRQAELIVIIEDCESVSPDAEAQVDVTDKEQDKEEKEQKKEEDEDELQSYMEDFVEKLA